MRWTAFLSLLALAACAPQRPVLVQPTPYIVPSDAPFSGGGRWVPSGYEFYGVVRTVPAIRFHTFGSQISTPESVATAGGEERRGRQDEFGFGGSLSVPVAAGTWLSVGLERASGKVSGVGTGVELPCPDGATCRPDPLGAVVGTRVRVSETVMLASTRDVYEIAPGTLFPATLTGALVLRVGQQRLTDLRAVVEQRGAGALRDTELSTMEYGALVRLEQPPFSLELQGGRLQTLGDAGTFYQGRAGFLSVGAVLHLGRREQ